MGRVLTVLVLNMILFQGCQLFAFMRRLRILSVKYVLRTHWSIISLSYAYEYIAHFSLYFVPYIDPELISGHIEITFCPQRGGYTPFRAHPS